jgi:aspartate ammonia-lyase
MTLGLEFGAWALMLAEDMDRMREAQALVKDINLGATPSERGSTPIPITLPWVAEKTPPAHRHRCSHAPDLVEATQDSGAYVQLSVVLKRLPSRSPRSATT